MRWNYGIAAYLIVMLMFWGQYMLTVKYKLPKNLAEKLSPRAHFIVVLAGLFWPVTLAWYFLIGAWN